MKERILSIIMILNMFFSVFPLSAFALDEGYYCEDYTEDTLIEDTIYEEDYNKASAISWDANITDNTEEIFLLSDISENNNKDIEYMPPIQMSDLQSLAAAEPKTITRYSVLVIDTSGSMRGTPIAKTIEAAKRFCDQVINAEGNNFVAIVTFNEFASTVYNFTTDLVEIKKKIDGLYANGGTSQYAGLVLADQLFNNEEGASSILKEYKNIIILSDGLPENGASSNDGPYKSTDYPLGYRYANAAYNKAQELKEKYNIYALGFFHSQSGSTLEFGKRFMKDLASDPDDKYYLNVDNPDELEFIFGKVADDVTKVPRLVADYLEYLKGFIGMSASDVKSKLKKEFAEAFLTTKWCASFVRQTGNAFFDGKGKPFPETDGAINMYNALYNEMKKRDIEIKSFDDIKPGDLFNWGWDKSSYTIVDKNGNKKLDKNNKERRYVLHDHVGIFYGFYPSNDRVSFIHGNWKGQVCGPGSEDYHSKYGYRYKLEYDQSNRVTKMFIEQNLGKTLEDNLDDEKTDDYIWVEVRFARPNYEEIEYENPSAYSGTLKLYFQCPIDVTVLSDNEELNSAMGLTATNWGEMLVIEDEIEVTLDYSKYYSISIDGNGFGTMDLIIEYNSNDGQNLRSFLNVPITPATIAYLSVNYADFGAELLVLDENGVEDTQIWYVEPNDVASQANEELTKAFHHQDEEYYIDDADYEEESIIGILVDTESVRLEYTIGETLDLNNLIVNAIYGDGSSRSITGFTTDPENGAILDTLGTITVTVSYFEDGIEKTTTFTIDVATHAHDYNRIIADPSCMEQGYTTATCSICEYSKLEDFTNALGHAWTEATVASTCSAQGYTQHTCANDAEHSYKDGYTPMRIHTWGPWSVNPKNAKEEICACTVCGAIDTRIMIKNCNIISIQKIEVLSFTENLQRSGKEAFAFEVSASMSDGKSYLDKQMAMIDTRQKGSKIIDCRYYAVFVAWDDDSKITACYAIAHSAG